MQNHDAVAANQTLKVAPSTADAKTATPIDHEPTGPEEYNTERSPDQATSEVPHEPTAAVGTATELSVNASPIPESVAAAVPAASDQDVEMQHEPPQPEAIASQGESTQTTEAPTAISPADVSFHPASMSRLAIDPSQELPSAPGTADTSMTDANSHPSAKVSRERPDDDNLDEPPAKRARTEDRDTVEATPAVAAAQGEPQDDAMAVDAPTTDAPPPLEIPPRVRPHGPAGTLGDPAQEGEPISAFGNKEIRKILASVKKTKAGGFFKDPVRVKWPDLWEAYIAKIEKPMDITAMEKALREGGYITLSDFVSDVFLIRENAIRFNGPEHMVTGQASSLVDNILTKLAESPAQEPRKPEKKETKQVATRHSEPRAATVQARRESRGAAASPAEEIAESPVFAIPPSGVPIIRRESTKNDGDRPKRPIHPPKNKDLGYEPKNLKKKKMSLEFRFCDEVLKELTKGKHWNSNQWFTKPVDPVQDNAPTYHKVIKKPMDLGTMQDKLNMGEYHTTKEFENDFHLIVKNCRKFNGDAPPTPAAESLLELFKQKWAEKDDWMAAHAPAVAASAPASATSPGGVAKDDDTEEEADASEPEADEEAAPETSDQLESLTARYKEEQRRLSEMLTAKTLDNTSLATQNSLIQFLMSQIVDEKTRLAAEAPKKVNKKTAAKSKPAKPKKTTAGTTTGAGGNKRNSTNAAGAASRKAGGTTKKAARRVMGQAEKNIVADAINNLDGTQLERAIDIIKRDTKQEVCVPRLTSGRLVDG